MVSARPWHPSAIMRLTLCLVVCLFCGSLLMSLAYRVQTGQHDLRFYRFTALAFGSAAVALVFVYRAWTPDTIVTRLGGYLVFLYAGFLLTWLAHSTGEAIPGSVSQMIIATLSLQGAALILVPHFLSEQALSWREAFGFANSPGRAIMMGIIVASVFLPLGMVLQWLSAELITHLPRLHLKAEQQESVQTLQMAVSWTNRLGLGVVTILVAPFAEEMFFRGILYPAVKRAGFPRLALWGTALVFAAIHLNLVTFIPLVVLAVGLTLLYERTDNLWGPITAHSLFNALNFVILYSTLGPAPHAA